LSFDEDILAFFVLATVLATFSKLWVIFSPQTSGHPTGKPFKPAITFAVKVRSLPLERSTRKVVHSGRFGWKVLPGTSTLAYFVSSSVTKKKASKH
jgi:hypothetical protein